MLSLPPMSNRSEKALLEQGWNLMKNGQPEEKDLPFVTYDGVNHVELWDDTDWFFELTDKEKLTHLYWKRVF